MEKGFLSSALMVEIRIDKDTLISKLMALVKQADEVSTTARNIIRDLEQVKAEEG